MASRFIGVIRSAATGRILAVVNPDDDSELDSPRWLLIRQETDAVEMTKVARRDYEATLTMDDVAKLVERLSP